MAPATPWLRVARPGSPSPTRGPRLLASTVQITPLLVTLLGERVAVVDAGNHRCHNQVHGLGPAGRRVVLYSSADLEAVTVMVSAAALFRLEVFVCRSAAALAIGRSDGCAEMET
jgi:hypothetical protein